MFDLYVVSTPIGNLEDISLRALRVLRMVKLIAAEDTRKTKRLLNAYDIKTPLTSYHEHNKWSKLDSLLRFLEETGDIALVSEAGTPGISDPGHELIVAAEQNGVPIIPIPGASVVIAALAISALPTDHFTFVGFLPRFSGQRQEFIKSVAGTSATLVVLEAPHRLRDTLTDLMVILGDRRISGCRELTKMHETLYRGTIGEILTKMKTEKIKGEIVVIVEV